MTALALGQAQLQQRGSSSGCVVVGAAHSGLAATQHLLAAGVPRVLLLSRTAPELHFVQPQPGGWEKYRGTGLLGPTADFAQALPSQVMPASATHLRTICPLAPLCITRC